MNTLVDLIPNSTVRYVTESDDVPQGEHYVILEFTTIYVPGDERSRTNIGHGYPESSVPIVKYIAYTNEDEWKDEITKRTLKKGNQFVALFVKQATISTSVNVKVSV